MTTLWRYALPSIKGEGWAIIVLGSDGFFAAVSDWGNYSYLWTHPGVADFREFFLREWGGDFDYFVGKFSPGRVYDAEATERSVKRLIIERRRDGTLTADQAREEWDDISVGSEVDYAFWRGRTRLGDDLYELADYSRDRQAVAFCERVLPRLTEAIRSELAAERTAAGMVA